MISIYLTRIFLFSFTLLTFVVANPSDSAPSAPESGPDQQQHLPDNHKRPDTLVAVIDGQNVLQSKYFKIWPGVWPTAIDWTAAVIGTSLSGVLSSFSNSSSELSSSDVAENLIERYFSQLSASYFGQDIFALMQEANDDALWVVIEWLDSIKFIEGYSSHYKSGTAEDPWYGNEWTPPFAHRARLFWDLASHGWDTTLCNGGMIWNSHLLPYKNAITNELYISASISMYLDFPGDDDTSSFGVSAPNTSTATTPAPNPPRDPKYLAAAVEAYRWLVNSNMTNNQGLYVDGFHVSGLKANSTNGNTKCDDRNEMVYTYNQGVILSGLHGLYEATGARSYLEDGHTLVSNVIAATGWDFKKGKPMDIDDSENSTRSGLGKWHGLGRSGILEDACDWNSSCSQDSQTFKGIYFFHLTEFCSEILEPIALPSDSDSDSPEDTRDWHREECASYGGWIRHNAMAALQTLDTQGRFGAWWGAPQNLIMPMGRNAVELPAGAVDYRSAGIPDTWTTSAAAQRRAMARGPRIAGRADNSSHAGDLNDRGRGRTVETQMGGISVLRALWEIVDGR